MTPKVSVITPVYNGAHFIADAVQSVLDQPFQDWELIVVDDGSTDDTSFILQAYDDPRIRIIYQQNGGAALARNRGLEVATGEFIGFLDADDLYLPNALQDLVSFLENNPTLDVVYSDGFMCDTNKIFIMCLSDIRSGVYTGWILDKIILSASIITVPVCTLTRHAAIQRCRTRFDTDLAPTEDYFFWIEMAHYGQFGYLDKRTCMYRIHQTNITHRTSKDVWRIDMLNCRLKIIRSSWFGDLAPKTRREFFYNLLIGLLGDQPKEQRSIINTPAFRQLPKAIQAELLRLVASRYLRLRQEPEFSLTCLKQSLSLHPEDVKSNVLYVISENNLSLTATVLSVWEISHRAMLYVRTIGQRKPKPVPAVLLPVLE